MTRARRERRGTAANSVARDQAAAGAAPTGASRSVGGAAQGHDSERGSVLLVVVLMTAAAMSVSSSLIERASLAAGELRARRAVLCARYAASAGLALGTPMSGAAAAALVSARAESLDVSRVQRAAGWCVLRATASCDGATRTLERTLADPSMCSGSMP